jgi:hypothetical protein
VKTTISFKLGIALNATWNIFPKTKTTWSSDCQLSSSRSYRKSICSSPVCANAIILTASPKAGRLQMSDHRCKGVGCRSSMKVENAALPNSY